MAGNKYLRNNAGQIEELAANQTSAGAGDAGKIVALDAGGHLDPTVMPTGIGADTALVPASEALAAGDLVNLWTDSGAVKARKADATTSGKEAVGFVLASVASGANATVYFDGAITGLTGLTPGSRYYLSTTPGTPVATAPSGTGNIVQEVGYALSATSLTFEPKASVKLA